MPLEERIMDIWFTIIICLRGQLDEVCSHSDDLVTAHLRLEHTDGDRRVKRARGETTSPHVECFLLSSRPPFVAGHMIRPVLASAEVHRL